MDVLNKMEICDKQSVRKLVAARQKTYSKAWVEEQSVSIQNQILECEDFKNASAIFCYVNFGKEVVTVPIIETALSMGKRVGVPLCLGKGIMDVHEITSLDQLKPGAYGILEPDASTPLIDVKDIDFGIIPCVSCNKKGERLGHGAGYYDRYLSKGNFVKAILCFDEMMEEAIPTDEHDVLMDYVVSQSGMVKIQ
ncbi:MAG: 5-formyltetrahydrofolate cyclo-ligase [Lachnospiraceae bacterium]|nr:5-formyltetrahydrofolate cyclo-ligase [Lachnospiraceae bacterium]